MQLKQRERPLYWFPVPSRNALDLPVTNWLEPKGDDTPEKQAEYWAVEAKWRKDCDELRRTYVDLVKRREFQQAVGVLESLVRTAKRALYASRSFGSRSA